jgi:hypothetical protein
MTSFTCSLLTKSMLQATQTWSHAFGRVNSIPGSPGSNEGSGYA